MKRTLELTADQAKGMLGKDTVMDALIKANFSGKELGLNIMDRLKTFQDALDITGETLENFEKRTEYDDDQEKAGKQLSVIYKAIREGVKTGRFYPYFYNPSGSGSGFSYCASGCDDVDSFVGARHTADTSEKAVYVGKQFTAIHERYING